MHECDFVKGVVINVTYSKDKNTFYCNRCGEALKLKDVDKDILRKYGYEK